MKIAIEGTMQSWFKISTSQSLSTNGFSVNIGNIDHIDNSSPDTGQYCSVNIVAGTSKPDSVLLIYRNQPIFEIMDAIHSRVLVEIVNVESTKEHF